MLFPRQKHLIIILVGGKTSSTIPGSKLSGQITIIPKPELRGFWGDSLTKPPFKVTSAEVVIIRPELFLSMWFFDSFVSLIRKMVGCQTFRG